MPKANKQALTQEERLVQALVPEGEQPYEVPENWFWLKLGSAVSLSDKKSNQFSSDVKYVGLEHIEKDCGIVSNGSATDVKSLKNVFGAGDILYGKLRPYLNKHGIATFDGICSTDILVFTPTQKCDIRLANYFLDLDGFIEYAVANSKGINLPRVSPGVVLSAPFPLPPLAEQHRIVSRIESLFNKLDRAKELAQAALDSFETRKAAILHKAFTGELTANWRAENPDTSNQVLAEIAHYATQKGKKEQVQIEEWISKSSILTDIGNSIWYKCNIGAIGVVTNGSTPSRKVDKYWDGSIPWVSSGEVRNSQIYFTNENITEEGFQNSSVKMLPVGTVLIAMIGEGKTRGQAAILEISATTNQNVAAIIIEHGQIVSKFLWYWLQREYQKNRERGNGTGPQALNCQRVRELDFVCPPLAEQQEIVRILDSLLEKEQQACHLADIIEKIDLMKKAILARAFRGELDTNDPNEESAMGLLGESFQGK